MWPGKTSNHESCPGPHGRLAAKEKQHDPENMNSLSKVLQLHVSTPQLSPRAARTDGAVVQCTFSERDHLALKISGVRVETRTKSKVFTRSLLSICPWPTLLRKVLDASCRERATP